MKLGAYAFRNVRQSKSVIFMIMLASMLICAVINLGFSMQQAIIDNILETVGDNQVRYGEISSGQVNYISRREEIERVDMHLTLKSMGIPVGGKKTEIGMIYSSALGDVAGFSLTSGYPPVSENEAAIPPHVAELLGIDPVVGSEFDLVLRTFDGEESTRHFTVSGILQRQRVREAMNMYFMFVSSTLAEQSDYDRLLYVRLWVYIDRMLYYRLRI